MPEESDINWLQQRKPEKIKTLTIKFHCKEYLKTTYIYLMLKLKTQKSKR